MMRCLVGLCFLALPWLCLAQSNLTTRVFTYDGTVATNGTTSYSTDGTTPTSSASSGTFNSNAITAVGAKTATAAVNTVIVVRTYIYVSGNFSGSFYVRGPSAGSSSTQTGEVEVRTNRPLTLVASTFTKILNSSNVVVSPSIGTITYLIKWRTGFPSTADIGTGTISGIDDATNGTSCSISQANISTTGLMAIQVQRTITLNQLAVGNNTYTATGKLVLTVN